MDYFCIEKDCLGTIINQRGTDADMISKHRITIFYKAVVLVCAIAFAVPVHGKFPQSDADKRENALKNAVNPKDSLKILFDVYDLSDKQYKSRVTGKILEIARRTDNSEALSDLIKELSGSTDDTRDLARLIEISSNLPEGEEDRASEIFIEMEHANVEAKTLQLKELDSKIIEFAKKGRTISADPYGEIGNLYKALAYLGSNSQGPMYLSDITRLESLVKNLPEKDHAIKNLFYTTAALFYTRKRDYKKAIEFDKELIKELDKISKRLPNDSISNLALDYFYYVSYRRMLRNYKGLPPQDVENAYLKCLELVDKNSDVRESFTNGGLTNSYYYMATGRYKEAIPEIKKALTDPGISEFRKTELTGHLAYALRETENKDEELKALREYTELESKERTQRLKDNYRELALQNNIKKIIADEFEAQEKDRAANRLMRKTAMTIVYVLALVLIFLCGAYFRLKQKVKLLETGNKKLRTNIEQIIDDGTPSGTRDLLHVRGKLKG